MNLVYTIEIERIHAPDWNRIAVPIDHDPLLDQIVVARFRHWRSADHVNLVYTIEIERIHAPDWNRIAVPIDHDPLWFKGHDIITP